MGEQPHTCQPFSLFADRPIDEGGAACRETVMSGSTGAELMSETESRTAITDDGREVTLGPDGMWTYQDTGTTGHDPYHFRRCRWGMTSDQVRESETAELIKESEEGLIFKGRVSRYPCLMAFIFAQGRLVRAKYNLLGEHVSPNDYFDDFEHLQGILVRKYGEPVDQKQHWLDDRLREEEESWGKAVALGHLVFWAGWQTEATEISLMLRGEDQRILLEVEYSSRELGNLEDSAETEVDELVDF